MKLKSIAVLVVWLTTLPLCISVEASHAQSRISRTPREIAQEILPSCVQVLCGNKEGKLISAGSGFYIAPDILVTCFHVIEKVPKTRIFVKLYGREDLVPAIVDSVDPEADLALLYTPSVTMPFIDINDEDPQVGDEVYAAGAPRFLESSFSNGIISGYRDHSGIGHWQTTAPISPGSSGGPLMDSSGKFVGVITGYQVGGQNLNFAVDAWYLANFFLGKRGSRVPGSHLAKSDNSKPESGSYDELLRSVGPTAKAPSRKPARPSADELYERGRTASSQNNFRQAAELFSEAIRLRPHFPDAHNSLGAALQMMKKYPDAIRAYSEALRQSPDDPIYLTNLGQACLLDAFGTPRQAEGLSKAIGLFKKAIKINPKYPDAHFALGLAHHYAGRRVDALEEYAVLKTLDPAAAERLFNLIYE